MIVKKDKTFERNSSFPSIDWYEEGNLIIDETTAEGEQMAQTVIDNSPFIEIENDGEFVTSVIVLDKPVKPPEVVGKEIELVKDESGQWVYVYKDVPLTEVEILKKELEATQQAMDFVIMNGGV